MKRWLWLALVGLGVFLLLGLGHAEAGRGVPSRPYIGCRARSVGLSAEPTPALPTTAPAAAKAAWPQVYAALFESRPLHLLLFTEGGVGLPWLDSRGPPGKMRETLADYELPARPVAQGNREVSPTPCSRTKPRTQEGGFATAFS